MSIAGDVLGIFKKDWKLFVAANVFLFGLFVLGTLAGLGGRDVRPEGIAEAARWALAPERQVEERLWLGLKR